MMFLQLMFSCMPAIYVGTIFFQNRKAERLGPDSADYPYSTPRCRSLGSELPIFFCVLFVMFLIFGAMFDTLTRNLLAFLQLSLEIILLLSVYYALLLPLLPLLRQRISARACAMLWMLPSALYYMGMVLEYQRRYSPIVLYIPETTMHLFYAFWLTGFLAMSIYYIVGHLRFRRQLLKNARPADTAAQMFWEIELHKACWKGTIPLVVSAEITTPLVIGLREKKLVALLPDRRYSVAEYRLIFQHELRHVLRRDTENKAFWCFCKAICWFNPLIWIAARKAADDLELSCDEFVLQDADRETRRMYAGLLLDAAGDGRGFSTCLSAAAGTLRHRMKCAVAPRTLRSGMITVVVLMLLLTLGNGMITISNSRGQLGDYIDLEGRSLRFSATCVSNAGFSTTQNRAYFEGEEGTELAAWLSELQVTALPEVASMREYSSMGKYWYELYFGDNQIMMNEHWITVEYSFPVKRGKDGKTVREYRESTFRLDEELDLALLGKYVQLVEAD